jgi:hypothetical protein
MALSLFVGFYYPSYQTVSSETSKMIFLGVMLPTLFVTGLTYKFPSSFRSDPPHFLFNKNVEETPLHKYIHTVPDSSYMVFFYSYTCPHCWNSIENFKQFKNSMAVDSIISFVLVNADLNDNIESKNLFIENFGDFGSSEVIDDSVISSFIKAVPTSFHIMNDTIKAVIEGELPHPFIFNKYYR